ncbi:hypothetical protein HMPREF6745_1873 [Prevotella sp. oral taxon 472 str. F0295]|nr:hypothetical protein HMPREF6745_1873 [Prevotella sp. oral taxon 472 str. F0295]
MVTATTTLSICVAKQYTLYSIMNHFNARAGIFPDIFSIFFIFHYIPWYALRVVFPRVKGRQAEQLHEEDTGLIVHLPILFSL